MDSKIIEVEAKFDLGKKRMRAYRLSENLCLLRFDKSRDVLPFISFSGIFSLTHIPSGVRVCLVKGQEYDLLEMANVLEGICDLSQPEILGLTPEQVEENTLAVSEYRVF